MWCGECLWFLACQAATHDVLAAWRPPAPLGACYLLCCLLPPPCPCLLQNATMQVQWLGMGMATQCPAVSYCACGVAQGKGTCSSLDTTLPFLFLPVSKMADAAWKRTNGAVKVKKSSSGVRISCAVWPPPLLPWCSMVYWAPAEHPA